MTYNEFRTGLTYSDVWKMCAVARFDPSDQSTFVRKGRVLSLWRKIKQDLWEEFCRRVGDPELVPAPARPRQVLLRVPSVEPWRESIASWMQNEPRISLSTIFGRLRAVGFAGSRTSLHRQVMLLRPSGDWRKAKTADLEKWRSFAARLLEEQPRITTERAFEAARVAGYAFSINPFRELLIGARPVGYVPNRPFGERRAIAPAAKVRRRPPQIAPRRPPRGAPTRIPPSLLTVPQAARLLRTTPFAVLAAISRGSYPGAVPGRTWRRWLIPRSEVDGTSSPAMVARAA